MLKHKSLTSLNISFINSLNPCYNQNYINVHWNLKANTFTIWTKDHNPIIRPYVVKLIPTNRAMCTSLPQIKVRLSKEQWFKHIQLSGHWSDSSEEPKGTHERLEPSSLLHFGRFGVKSSSASISFPRKLPSARYLVK